MKMVAIVYIVSIIVLMIIFFMIYHSIFNVVYFGDTCLQLAIELAVCGFLAAFTVRFVVKIIMGIIGGILSLLKGIFLVIIFLIKVAWFIGSVGILGYGIYLLINYRHTLNGEKKGEDTNQIPDDNGESSALSDITLKKSVCCIAIGVISVVLLFSFNIKGSKENGNMDESITGVESVIETYSNVKERDEESNNLVSRIDDFDYEETEIYLQKSETQEQKTQNNRTQNIKYDFEKVNKEDMVVPIKLEEKIGEEHLTYQESYSQYDINESYVFSQSSDKYIEESDLWGMSYEQARLAVNEIYARHGRKFKDAELQEYFNDKSWYKGTVEPDNFDEAVFNTYEKKNINTIRSYMDTGKAQFDSSTYAERGLTVDDSRAIPQKNGYYCYRRPDNYNIYLQLESTSNGWYASIVSGERYAEQNYVYSQNDMVYVGEGDGGISEIYFENYGMDAFVVYPTGSETHFVFDTFKPV